MARTEQSHINLAARMGRWSAGHWKTATFGWLALVVVAFAIGGIVGTKTHRPEHVGAGRVRPHGPDPRRRLQAAGRRERPDPERLAEDERSRLRGRDRGRRRTEVSCLDVVQHVRSPLDPANAGQIAKSGHAALVEFEIRGDPDKAVDKIGAVLDRVDEVQQAHPQLFIGEFGDASAENAVVTAYGDDLAKAGLLSLPVTLIILVLAFGALVAAGIPLLLGLTAVFATFGLLALPSQVLPMAMQVPAIVLLIGLAVGVDYSMFYLRRVREERAAGRSESAALEAAAATSGHSVLISGLTVMAAMAGMFLTGDSTFASMGVATILVVAIAVLGSLTVLPALLSKLGDRVDRARVPVRRPAPPRRRRGPDLGRDRRPRPPAAAPVGRPRGRVAGRARTAGAAAPHGSAGAGDVPEVAPGHAGLRPHAAGLPRHGAPRHGRREGSGRERTRRARGDRPARAARDRERPDARADHGRRQQRRHRREHHRPDRRHGSRRRVDRGDRGPAQAGLPETVGQLPNVEAGVTGLGAGWKDSTDELKSNLPPVVAFVLVLAFGLMLVAFRSIVVAAKAIVLNLLSVAAAYGVLVIVFQYGFAQGLLGFGSTAGIDPVVPLLLFVILFGLSMDYHVLVLSRIRELFDRGATMDEAVSQGIKSTAGVVTSAAVVMVAVFSVFATLSMLMFKQFGVGLAAAILIDATIVRAVLLPATMKLLGEWNWYLPRWLEWLPGGERRTSEPAPELQPAPTSA